MSYVGQGSRPNVLDQGFGNWNGSNVYQKRLRLIEIYLYGALALSCAYVVAELREEEEEEDEEEEEEEDVSSCWIHFSKSWMNCVGSMPFKRSAMTLGVAISSADRIKAMVMVAKMTACELFFSLAKRSAFW